MASYGCQKKGNIYIDNSGKTPVIALVNGQSYKIPPMQGVRLELKAGTHEVRVNNEVNQPLKEGKISIEKGGVINAGNTPYILWTDLYGDPQLKKEKLREDWLTLDGTQFYGEFKLWDSTQLYIEKVWDYGIEQAFPVERMGWSTQSKDRYIIRTKIFSKPQFITEYLKMAQQAQP